MEVILLEKVENLGNLGDKVKVRSGYGRNYLLPQGKATTATPENIKAFEERRAELEKIAAESLAEANARKEKIEGASVVIKAKAGDEGKLFGSVGAGEVAEAVSQAAGVEVEKREVRMPSGPLRSVGEYEVELHLHTDVNVAVNVTVEAE